MVTVVVVASLTRGGRWEVGVVALPLPLCHSRSCVIITPVHFRAQCAHLPEHTCRCVRACVRVRDSMTTTSYVRANAGVKTGPYADLDGTKIGFAGFSAGGHLTAHISTAWAPKAYPPTDAADASSSRPDFSVPVSVLRLCNLCMLSS